MNRRWMSLAILGILVPVGLLVTFRITGILQEPIAAPENITVETVSWQMDRPSRTGVKFNERVENAYINKEASVSIGVHICTYHENDPETPYEGKDGVAFQVYVNTGLEPGFSATFAVRFCPIDYNAVVFVSQQFLVSDNATVTRMKQISTDVEGAYVLAKATNSSCHLSILVYWVFKDQNVEDHQLKVVLEFTYRSRSVYKEVVLPIMLAMVRDIGDTFDTAKCVATGEYRGGIDSVDYIDMYAIEVQEGQTLKITMNPPEDANYDLYLYDPGKTQIANSTLTGNKPELITHIAESTGTWYVKVKLTDWEGHINDGIYTLKVEVPKS